MGKLLIVDDDIENAKEAQSWLEQERHVVDFVADGKSALDYLKTVSYDLLILDWNLPDISGLDLLRQIRSGGCTTVVLMLTGYSDMEHKVQGFETGADDYLTKPFNPKELLLRVKALLRRPAVDVDSIISSGALAIDTNAYKVLKNGKPIRLSPTEFNLLLTLVRHPRTALSADVLISKVWPTDSEATSEQVRKYVQRLRDKIDDTGAPSLIRTIHGVGYAWEPQS